MRDILRGQNITVGLFQYQLEEVEEGSGSYRIPVENPGAAIRFLDELAEKGGFSWRDSYGIITSPDYSLNQTWTGLLHWTIDTYDLMGDWYLRTLDRLGTGIAFPEGWYDGSLIMVQKKPDPNDFGYDFWAFISPFTSDVWWMLIGTTVASGLVFAFLDFLNSKATKDEMELSLTESLYATSIVFSGHLIHLPNHIGGKIMTFSLAFVSLLIISAYTANLASFLVLRNTPTLVVYDISDAIKYGMSFCVLESSTSEKTLREDYGQYPINIIPLPSIAETYHGVLNGDCDMVLTTVGTFQQYEVNPEFNPGCDSLEWVGRVVKPFVAGFSMRDSVVRCSSLLRDALSLHMIDLKLERRDDRIWDDINGLCEDKADTVERIDAAPSVEEVEESQKLGLDTMGGILAFHLILSTCAVAVALVTIKTNAGKKEEEEEEEEEERKEENTPQEQETTIPVRTWSRRIITTQAPSTRFIDEGGTSVVATLERQNPSDPSREAGVTGSGTSAASSDIEDDSDEAIDLDPKLGLQLAIVMLVAIALSWASFFALMYL